MENISSVLDLGWGQADRVPLPGFGFFPPRVVKILENITAVKTLHVLSKTLVLPRKMGSND